MTALLSSTPWLPGTHGVHGLAHLPAVIGGNLKDACKSPPGIACRLVWDITHSKSAASLTDTFLAGPVKLGLRIAFVVILALVIRAIMHRTITKLTQRAAEPAPGRVDAALRLRGERRHQRAEALGSLLRNISSVVIFGIAGVTIAGYLGVNLAPVLASAGVVGVAVGFGAQSLVKDFLSGIFMLLEDQYGVGDLIDAGQATGTVEAVGLRTTRLRDVSGVVWHIRNGAIDRIGNQSQGWSRAVVDFPVSYRQDLGRVRAVMKDAADQMWADPRWHELIVEEPEVWGVESVYSDAVVVRLVAKTVPMRQSQVARELRERVKTALDLIGVDAEPTIAAPGASPGAPAPEGAGTSPDTAAPQAAGTSPDTAAPQAAGSPGTPAPQAAGTSPDTAAPQAAVTAPGTPAPQATGSLGTPAPQAAVTAPGTAAPPRLGTSPAPRHASYAAPTARRPGGTAATASAPGAAGIRGADAANGGGQGGK